jgi:sortase A
MAWLVRFERLAWTAGILLVAVWVAAYVHKSVLSRRDLARFETAMRARITPARVLPGEAPPDQTLWSKERVHGYEESLKEKSSDPLAVLRIPKIGLEVAVLDGTDDLTLNRAVGHIADTPRPGENGNVGIAGHRDGFFRGLKDVVCGDTMELETLSGKETYRVDDIWIVNPEDIQVLDPTPGRALTLVACYPFYFVGSAPKRYIVRAVPQGEPAATSRVP